MGKVISNLVEATMEQERGSGKGVGGVTSSAFGSNRPVPAAAYGIRWILAGGSGETAEEGDDDEVVVGGDGAARASRLRGLMRRGAARHGELIGGEREPSGAMSLTLSTSVGDLSAIILIIIRDLYVKLRVIFEISG